MTPFLDPTQNSTPDNIYLHSVTPSLPSLYSEEESFLLATNIAYNIQLSLSHSPDTLPCPSRHDLVLYQKSRATQLSIDQTSSTISKQSSRYLFYRNAIWLPHIMHRWMMYGFYQGNQGLLIPKLKLTLM